MSVQFSYKKQFAFLLLLTLTFLAVVEVLVNVWLYYFYHCDFEDNEIFKNVNPEINRKVCVESLGIDNRLSWLKGTRPGEVFGGLDENLVYINSHGFRGLEFTEIKPDNTYRIFTVGGSTTFGIGVLDNQTFPFYLQELYDNTNLGFKVEVIDSSWPWLWSLPETEIIKKQLINFEPDLFIIYDGVNDLRREVKHDMVEASALLWKERWTEICNLGKQHDFDTIIALQPFISTGKKILTIQEYELKILNEREKYLENYSPYVESLSSLNDYCSLTADLRGLFDHERDAIYFDLWHTGPKGNQIIAEKFYFLSLPLILEHERTDFNEDYEAGSFEGMDPRLISNGLDLFTEEFYYTLRDIVSPYKTPKVFSLIFE